MDTQPQNINLRYTVPVVTSDGHIISISENGTPTILFFQARDQHNDHMHGDVVSAVRLNTMEDLEGLAKAIKETIDKHKNREP